MEQMKTLLDGQTKSIEKSFKEQMQALDDKYDAKIKVLQEQQIKDKKEIEDKLASLFKEFKENEGNDKKRSRSAGAAIGKSPKGDSADEGFKVKAAGFPMDTRKADAEDTLIKCCAMEEGYIEAYMPGSRNEIAFVKFDSDTARRRFLNRIHSDQIKVMHGGQKIRFSRCRTLEQKEKTKHIDKAKRVIIEAITAKYPNVDENVFKETVETGMKDGGVVWIGGVRVATMVANGAGEKVFAIDPEKLTSELLKTGWEIDGNEVVASHKVAMQ